MWGRASTIVLVLMTGCGASHESDDGGLDGAAPREDAGREADAGRAIDAGSIDAGSTDAGSIDAGPFDGGAVTCAPTTCGARACGRSTCGASCGGCSSGWYCGADGSCRDPAVTPAPGEFCIDAFGERVVEGGRSFRTCPTDDALLQSCLCSGGGPDAWVGCGDCEEVVLAGARGDRCATDDQCGGVPCHPYLHLCGEPCDRGLGTVCPGGTACGVPGDIAGACLPACTDCGTGCSESTTCRGTGAELVCVPSDYVWPSSDC